MTTTWCCINHHDYIYIKSIYRIPCIHKKRHPIPHSHEWVNNFISVGDSFENNDRVIKRLHITIKFANFSLPWIYHCYMVMSLGESRGVCLNTPVWGPWDIYLSNNGHHFLPLIHGLMIMAKQLEHHNMTHTPAATRLGGVYWFHLVRRYLQQYSPDPFRIYTSYRATSAGVSHVTFVLKWKKWTFGKFFNFVTLTLSCFDLGSNMK